MLKLSGADEWCTSASESVSYMKHHLQISNSDLETICFLLSSV